MRIAAGAVAAAAAAVLIGVAIAGGEGDDVQVAGRTRGIGSQPNVVFMLADDMNLPQFNRRYMRRTRKLIADPGTEFTNYFAATPLCCPSRAAMLTGQYGHNNGVTSNVPGYGLLEDPEQHPARLAADRRLPDGRGRQVAERLREDGRASTRRCRRAGTSGTAWSAPTATTSSRRPNKRQEGQLHEHLRHRLDRRHLDRPDRQARLGRQALLPPGQRVRPARRERPQRESRPLRGGGGARASGPGQRSEGSGSRTRPRSTRRTSPTSPASSPARRS